MWLLLAIFVCVCEIDREGGRERLWFVFSKSLNALATRRVRAKWCPRVAHCWGTVDRWTRAERIEKCRLSGRKAHLPGIWPSVGTNTSRTLHSAAAVPHLARVGQRERHWATKWSPSISKWPLHHLGGQLPLTSGVGVGERSCFQDQGSALWHNSLLVLLAVVGFTLCKAHLSNTIIKWHYWTIPKGRWRGKDTTAEKQWFHKCSCTANYWSGRLLQ